MRAKVDMLYIAIALGAACTAVQEVSTAAGEMGRVPHSAPLAAECGERTLTHYRFRVAFLSERIADQFDWQLNPQIEDKIFDSTDLQQILKLSS